MTGENTRWHSLSLGELFSLLGTKTDGLTTPEALRRLQRQGPNVIGVFSQKSWWRLYLKEFTHPLILLLFGAGVVTILVGSTSDSIVIFLVAIVNSIVGFWQAQKAEKTIRSLQQKETHFSTVKRDGSWKKISSAEIVPGDILLLKAGEKIPADARLTFVEEECMVEEAILTGEAEPRTKRLTNLEYETELSERENMLWKDTLLISGKGEAAVVATGVSTLIGQLGVLTAHASETKTPFEIRVARLGRLLTFIVAVAVLALFGLGVLLGREVSEMFVMAVAVTVSTIPEGLPIVLTVILSVGIVRIAKAGGLVKSLSSAQSLGSTSVILTDKTGTLTEGKMSVDTVFTFGRKSGTLTLEKDESQSTGILKMTVLTTDVVIENSHKDYEEWKVHGTPTEQALIKRAIESEINVLTLEEENPLITRVPFTSSRAFAATVRKENNKFVAYVLGSPEKIVSASSHVLSRSKVFAVSSEDRKDIHALVSDLAAGGYRMLAISFKTLEKGTLDDEDIEKGLTIAGLIAIKDPVRKDAAQSFLQTQSAGIRTIIVTGDHAHTAISVAREIGMQKKGERSFVVMEGHEVMSLSEEDLARKVRNVDIFARVSPIQKFKIVKAWQAHKEVVATFGDGVNDAPALKQADVGVVVGTGTDLAKEASDIVLQKNSFSTIVSAVREGRVIIDNLKKALTYILSDSFTELILLSVAILARLPLPILPAQILWAKIIADIGPGISLAFEPQEKDVMSRRPQAKDSSIIDKEMRFIIVVVGFLTDVILVGLFLFFLAQKMPIENIQTIMFTALALETVFYAFSMRSLRRPLWKIDFFSNPYLLAASVAGIALTVAAVYLEPLSSLLRTQPLTGLEWIIITGFGIVNVIAIETAKWLFWRKKAV